MPVFKSSNGRVDYKVAKLHGCCGVAVVYNVHFDPEVPRPYTSPTYDWPKKDIVRYKDKCKHYRLLLYKDFYNFITTASKPFNLNRCKIIMSDQIHVTEQRYGSIEEFCKRTPRWRKGSKTLNRKSGHYIQVFELDREVVDEEDF